MLTINGRPIAFEEYRRDRRWFERARPLISWIVLITAAYGGIWLLN
jgi:hypothetical protein